MIPHCVNTDFRIVSSGKRWGHGRQNAMAGFAEYATFQPKGMTRFETAEAPPAEHRTFERGTRIEPDASEYRLTVHYSSKRTPDSETGHSSR